MKRNGFTMIELLVAVAIMGVLSIIAIPTVKHIQAQNRKAKFIAYEKAIKSATKAYADSFDEDLFGGKNTGCAIVKFSELKEKDLIQDIQLKDIKCDQDEETFVYVLKNNTGNRGFFSHTVCRSGKEVVYSNKDDNRTKCKLDDGKGPEAVLIVTPDNKLYHIGDNPTAKIYISDDGVGLKSRQKLKYQWYKDDDPVFSKEKTATFGNRVFAPDATAKLKMPPDMEDIHDPTNYKLVVTGTVYDANGVGTEVKIERTLEYFVGALLIRMKANGGHMIDPHGSLYSVASDDYITRGTNDKIISKIKYNSTADLWDYDNEEYINIRKDHYHLEPEIEWKRGSKEYNQKKDYDVTAFGLKNEDLIFIDQIVDVSANWIIDKHSITFDPKGGTECSPKSFKKDYGSTWGTLCTTTKKGYKFNGWKLKDSNTIITSESKVSEDIVVEAQWQANICSITYDPNGGTFSSSAKTQTCTYGNDCVLKSATGNGSLGASKTGNRIVANSEWKIGSKTLKQSTTHKAEDLCSDLNDGNKTVTIYANWSPNTCTITYNANGGGFNAYTTTTTQTCTYGNTCNLYDATSSWYNATKTGNHIPAGKEWTNGSTTFNQNSNDNAEKICSNLSSGDSTASLSVNWQKNTCTITYSPNGGKFNTNSTNLTQSCTYGDDCNLKDATSTGYSATKDGYSVHSSYQWYNGQNKYTQVKGNYNAEEICANLDTGNRTKNLYVNWVGHTCTISYSANGGGFKSHTGDLTQVCYYGSSCDLNDINSNYYNAAKDWYHYNTTVQWYNGSRTFSQGSHTTQDICTNLSSGNKTITLYANWDKNKVYFNYHTNGGHLSASPDQACPLPIPKEYRSGCTRTTNLDGCTGQRSGFVFSGAGADFDSTSALSVKGVRDYSSKHEAGDFWNLYMTRKDHKATGNWIIGDKRINESTVYAKPTDLASAVGRYDDLKNGNITLDLYAEWS